jgi:hypothetical protein
MTKPTSAFALLLFSAVVMGCGGQDPAVLWLARHGNAPRRICEHVAKRRIAPGMPKDAVLAVVGSMGFRILEEKTLAGGTEHIVYREIAYDAVGNAHSAKRFLIFRNGILISIETFPQR